MNRIKIEAPAKINLTLDVLGRRENGYHDVEMIMQSITLSDTIYLEKLEKEGIQLIADNEEIPKDSRNIAVKAAEMMFEAYHLPGGISIEIDKRIPVAAGLAGGSTNAAAVLLGINRMYDLNCSEEELDEIGVKIGADVPFCIHRGTCLSQGIGEELTRLPDCPEIYLVLIKPDFPVSTKEVYEAFDSAKEVQHPDTEKMQTAIQTGNREQIVAGISNVLEAVTVKQHPVIQEIKDTLNGLGADNSLMSGSGPTVFGVFLEEEKAKQAFVKTKEKYGNYRVCLGKTDRCEFKITC